MPIAVAVIRKQQPVLVVGLGRQLQQRQRIQQLQLQRLLKPEPDLRPDTQNPGAAAGLDLGAASVQTFVSQVIFQGKRWSG